MRERVERSIYRAAKGFYIYVSVKGVLVWRGPYESMEIARTERAALAGRRPPIPRISVSYSQPKGYIRSNPWRLRIGPQRRHVGYFPTWDDAWKAAGRVNYLEI